MKKKAAILLAICLSVTATALACEFLPRFKSQEFCDGTDCVKVWLAPDNRLHAYHRKDAEEYYKYMGTRYDFCQPQDH